MRVHRSNSAAELLDGLARLIEREPPGPFHRETIVVQGKGMERWISMELARRRGVWANPEFPFPRTIVNRAIGAVLGDEAAERGPFEPDPLVWSVAGLLPGLVDGGGQSFREIRRYLGEPPKEEPLGYDRRLLQLSRQVADVFGRYVLYRPDVLRRWEESGEEGYEEGWQPVLWRKLVAVHGKTHLAARVEELVRVLSEGEGGKARQGAQAVSGKLPSRISIFGASTLAPVYMDAFAALSRWIAVELFLPAPSQEFMGGVASRQEMLRERRRQGPDAELHDEITNPLVASLGTLGRDFQSMLEEWEYTSGEELFVDPFGKRRTMLTAVQSDMLHLRERRAGGNAAPEAISPGDDTIQVHVCHSPMREIEVLHDRLLALFDADESLEPRHVVVMAPSIDEYAPYIDAVFLADQSRPRIPYHVADRGPRIAERVVDAFFRSLEVLRGRMTAPEVFDLLAMEPVREQFGIPAAELETVRNWIADSGIRWGIDGNDRAEFGQPELWENTWRFGLERLFLGFAMAPDDEAGPWQGVLPVDGIEGTGAEVLGQFGSFLETLFDFRKTISESATVPEWTEWLRRLLGTLVSFTSGTADEHRRLLDALEKVEGLVADAGFDRRVRLEAVLPEFEAVLAAEAPAHGLLSGGVTFCAMVPMRSIPFRVVCLVGMNDGAFPRTVRPPGFDLTARQHRRGDRTRRDDDRHLFLESILSAEEKLLITYVGQGIRDNSSIPPSVVLNQLLDVIGAGFFRHEHQGAVPAEQRQGLLEHVVVRHPLQGFSERYFTGDGRLTSYAGSAFAAARAKVQEWHEEPKPFVAEPLWPAITDEPPLVSLTSLERFLEHPPRWFCQERLGLWLGRDGTLLDDREPVEVDNLARWAIGDLLLPWLVRGMGDEQALELLLARGVLPPGTLGKALYEEIRGEARRIADLARPYLERERHEAVPVDATIHGVRLIGTIGVHPGGQVDCRYSRLGGKHETRLWLRHLVLQVLRGKGEDVPCGTVLLGRPAREGEAAGVCFETVRDADERLAELIEVYRAGATAPVPLFPRVSRTYAEIVHKPGKSEDAAQRARSAVRRTFRGEDWSDGNDDYVRRIFGDEWIPCESEPPGAHAGYSFEDLARRIFLPLLQHRKAIG